MKFRGWFQKSALNDPKMTWHVCGQKSPRAYLIHPRDPNWHRFSSTMNSFQVTAEFWEKCTGWPKMTFNMFNCSRSKVCITQGPNFCPISCFEFKMVQLWKMCTKWPKKWPWHVQGEKYTYTLYTTYIHQAQMFIQFGHYFWSMMSPFKSQQNS